MKIIKKTITRRDFILATNSEPSNDDIERCNCKDAGKAGHYWSGWCNTCDKPRFFCGCMPEALKPRKEIHDR